MSKREGKIKSPSEPEDMIKTKEKKVKDKLIKLNQKYIELRKKSQKKEQIKNYSGSDGLMMCSAEQDRRKIRVIG